MATAPGAAGAGAPYPQWTYNTTTHVVSKVTSAAAKIADETVSFPATILFFTSQSAADAYAQSHGGGTDVSNSPLTGAANATASAAPSVPGLSQLTGFLSRLAEANLWERVAEVVIGAALIAVGVAHLFNVKLPSAVPVPV